jgi:magnesium chelatase family protein
MARPEAKIAEPPAILPDLAEIKGQETAKRALEVSAAGGHNLLMVGPPGAGKSMLAARLPSILPPLSPAELLEVSMIASIAGELTDAKLSNRRPFRAPHHSASMAAMVGGGLRIRPGEASLAHHGVLFLDELPEFAPPVIDSLRQPLEAGEIAIARANNHVTYPARFQLVAAMNPCRCGLAGVPGHSCARGPRCAADYQARLSGPFLDRIDIRLEVPAVSAADLIGPANAEPSRVVAERVAQAREIQRERLLAIGARTATNAAASTGEIEKIVRADAEATALLRDAAESLRLSARGYHRVLKVARTLADLDGAEATGRLHIAEALSFRIAGARTALAA